MDRHQQETRNVRAEAFTLPADSGTEKKDVGSPEPGRNLLISLVLKCPSGES